MRDVTSILAACLLAAPALAALREPSEAMIEAAWDGVGCSEPKSAQIFRVMIDAAMEDKA